jgi:cytochrome c biogenesis protein CcdA/thiol-disulfide isomerase/thioredoxin
MLVLLGIAFLAGVITSLSPCVLPVLPILLAGGAAARDPKRPYLIIAGLVASFTAFTLGGAWLLDQLGLPDDFLRDLAIALLLLLAATLLWPWLAHQLERPFLFLTRRRVSADRNGVVLGLSLGLVFVPCAGPVLAAVTALSASGQVGVRTFLVTLFYAAGAAIPMLAIALGGQRLTSGVALLRRHAQTTRRVSGAVLGATALAIAFDADTRFTTAIPGYTEALQERIERNGVARRELAGLTGSGEAAAAGRAGEASQAPEFQGIEAWLNTTNGRPLSLAGLRGRVVLIDFWTYSCINCLRTLPHLKAWDTAYRSAGLTIVGVHTPEFGFERVPDNVRSAVGRLGLRYPIALDTGYKTWTAYHNQYWPAKYLIDRSGRIRYTHFGEGEYDETEGWIRRLLGERLSVRRTSVADKTPTEATTAELYLGYGRIASYRGSRIVPDREAGYRFARFLAPDELSYAGRWRVDSERIVAGDRARLRLRFRARHVFLVLAGHGRLDVSVDGRSLRTIRVSGTPRLYTLARFPTVDSGLLELRFARGLEGYAFTFG